MSLFSKKKTEEQPMEEKKERRCFYCRTTKDVSSYNNQCGKCMALISLSYPGVYEELVSLHLDAVALLNVRKTFSSTQFRCYRDKILEQMDAYIEKKKEKERAVAMKRLSVYKECKYID